MQTVNFKLYELFDKIVDTNATVLSMWEISN